MGKPIPYEENHRTNNEMIEKKCNRCDKWYPMNEKYYYKNDKNKTDGFYPYCKKCAIESSYNWWENNKEKHRENHKKYEKTQKFKEWMYKNQIETREYRIQYRKDHPEQMKEYTKKKTMNSTHKITKNEWESCKKYFNYECAYCGLPITEHYYVYRGKEKLGDFHKEHVIHNGSNDLSNCVPSCKSCNSQKHTSDFEEWYNKNNLLYSEGRYNKIKQWLECDYKQYLKSNK